MKMQFLLALITFPIICVNWPPYHDDTPLGALLHVAARNGNVIETQRILKRMDININEIDSDDNTALDIAIEKNYDQLSVFLWAAGARPRRKKQLSRPLLEAQEKGIALQRSIAEAILNGSPSAIEYLKYLSKRGYSLMISDKLKNNALHYALAKNKPHLALFLYKYNPDLLYRKNSANKTPLDFLYAKTKFQAEGLDELWKNFLDAIPREHLQGYRPPIELALLKCEQEGCHFASTNVPDFESHVRSAHTVLAKVLEEDRMVLDTPLESHVQFTHPVLATVVEEDRMVLDTPIQ